ncbi:hypothetical protein N8608_02085 [bacterium]|nr:hypothetical protein [bacterium]
MDDIGLPKEMQQRIQAVLREHNKMPKQTLMDHVIELRKEAGLGATEVQQPLSLMDHVIAMRQEIERLRAEAGISPAEAKAATAAAIRAAVEEAFKSRVS